MAQLIWSPLLPCGRIPRVCGQTRAAEAAPSLSPLSVDGGSQSGHRRNLCHTPHTAAYAKSGCRRRWGRRPNEPRAGWAGPGRPFPAGHTRRSRACRTHGWAERPGQLHAVCTRSLAGRLKVRNVINNRAGRDGTRWIYKRMRQTILKLSIGVIKFSPSDVSPFT